MDFPLYFKNVISKWPKGRVQQQKKRHPSLRFFKRLTMGVLEFLVHNLKENHPVPLKS